MVTGLTTPTSRTLAQTDGSWKVESSAAPIRFRDAQGRWQSIDLTLARRDDGTVAPKHSPVRLTMAGRQAAVTAGSGAHEISVGSPGGPSLPELSNAPELSDADATHPQVVIVDTRPPGYLDLDYRVAWEAHLTTTGGYLTTSQASIG